MTVYTIVEEPVGSGNFRLSSTPFVANFTGGYLTEAEYRDAVDDQTVSVPARMLAAATNAVDSWLVSAIYATSPAGWPLDLSVAAAIKWAMVEQVTALLQARQVADQRAQASASSVLGAPLKAASIDGVSWTADDQAEASRAHLLASEAVLCDAARAMLARIPRYVGVIG